MYLHFFNLDTYNPAAVVIGPCFLNITRGVLRISPGGDTEGAEVRAEDGNYIVNGKTFSDIETLESLDFAPADCKILTADQFAEQETAIREFTPHGTYTISNACGYEVEISRDGEAARLRINGNEPTTIVTEWLPIEAVEMEDFAGYEHFIDVGSYNVPLSEVMTIN